MFTRKTVLAAALTAASIAFATAPAQAQTYYYGVQSTSQTLGYVGTFPHDSGWLPGGTLAETLSDPVGATMSAVGYATLYADVAASSKAQTAELRATATSHANVVSGSNIQPAAAPYGYGYAYFYDRLTVKSDTLPKGTPVTIVFGNVVEVNKFDRTGPHDGYIEMNLQIATGTARSRWTASSSWGDTTAVAPQLQIRTTVGSKLSVDAKLRVQAKTFYQLSAAGDMHADATARLVINEIPDGVTLQADSGTVYPVVPAN